MGRVHVLAVLKMVRADLVRVVQLHCSFRAKITWPSVYDSFLGPVKGRCWSKNCFAHFSIHSFHFTFIMIQGITFEKARRATNRSLEMTIWCLGSDLCYEEKIYARGHHYNTIRQGVPFHHCLSGRRHFNTITRSL